MPYNPPYRGGAPEPTYQQKCATRGAGAWSVAERNRWETLAQSGPLSRTEMEQKRDGALDVAGRNFWQARIDELG